MSTRQTNIDLFNYKRRATVAVKVGALMMGSDYPVRVQSMTNTSTMDTEGSVAQIARIVERGGELVRLTTQGSREAVNMGAIKEGAAKAGCNVPLVADVHFNASVADVAAQYADKVRVNPGNYVDTARTFKYIEYTDEEYARELERLSERFTAFLALCKREGKAIRVGVNHGSLSDRIMSRYGDTPEGVVESCMEFLRICRRENFDNVVVSIKTSNTPVMVTTVRLLNNVMASEGIAYPLHLGVTEAGDAEDGRIKSAVGIGALLADGIGDTIRVSLTEAPEYEIPVAKLLVEHFSARTGDFLVAHPELYSPTEYRRRSDIQTPIVRSEVTDDFLVIDATSANPTAEWRAAILSLENPKQPVVIRRKYTDSDITTVAIKAAADMGALLLDGLADGVWIDAPQFSEQELQDVELNILQASRVRISHTEYIACPSCGRTLYDIEGTLAQIKARTSHLKGLKIGVMGCIVNGPGEMADADYGYVGAAAGKITLYKGREVVCRNIPQSEALDRLIEIIKENGDWREC